ncbi:hypothetical protein [Mycolicibacterium sp. PDY-3]|uniref:hypothetical protein n=1 Tax=Mycolicibacterium sp. PDY-3 TaxID=3376069 RepID=UPI00379A7FEF
MCRGGGTYAQGTDLLRLVGMAPGAAARAVRVGRRAPGLPALTIAQRLGGIGIEFADAVGKGVTHIESRVALSDEDRATVVRALMVQTTPAEVAAKARAIALDRIAALPPSERAVPVAEDTTLNEMTVVQNTEGRFEATLDLDVTTGEELCAALDPLCRPVPLPDGVAGPTINQRPAGRGDRAGTAHLFVTVEASDVWWGVAARHPHPAGRRGNGR